MIYKNPKYRAYLLFAFALTYNFFAAIFLFWLLKSGELFSAAREVFDFFRSGGEIPGSIGMVWMDINLLGSFGALMFLLSVVAIAITFLVIKRVKSLSDNPDEQIHEDLLKQKPLRLLMMLVYATFLEELIFRFLFIGIGSILWHGKVALMVLVLLSSIIFGLVHVFNQNKGQRIIALTTPQMFSGVILAYFFLTYGFFAAWALHFIFNLAIIIPIYSSYWGQNIYLREVQKEEEEIINRLRVYNFDFDRLAQEGWSKKDIETAVYVYKNLTQDEKLRLVVMSKTDEELYGDSYSTDIENTTLW
ncbi:MAG: CPBP family intramembrane glutamic endopeptidase [Candidatus Spechtbacterales bacterium]|nr:CPBP family intramembrane glutamic endopeptidase [Candidatus Spechtbacterales bacterium]